MKSHRVVNWVRFVGVAPLVALLGLRGLFAVISWFCPSDEEKGVVVAYYVLASILGLAVYAGYRAHRQNPATNWRYSEWLKLTPWRWGRPLPLGSTRLSLADGLLLLLFAALCPLGWWYGLAIGVVAFAIGSLAVIVQCAITHGEPLLSYGSAILFGLGIAFSFGPHGPTLTPLFFALMGALLLSQLTLPRILKRFDELKIDRSIPLTKTERKLSRDLARSCGSPWTDLLEAPAEKLDEAPSDRAVFWWLRPLAVVAWLFACCENARQRLMQWVAGLDPELLLEETSLWGGLRYVCYSMCAEAPGESVRDGASAAIAGATAGFLLLGSISLILVMGRIIGHWPPISLLGRIATRRWVIPGYDYVFLGPLVSLLVYAVAAAILVATNAVGVLAGGLAFVAALPALMLLTPSMEEWRYTGHHRIVCSKPSPDRR